MPGVQLDNISRHFAGHTAVDGISLRVEPGEFVTLLGPSGCGKTTTLRMVAGLEQNDSGRITIGNRVVSDADSHLFLPPDKRDIGMVFQSYAIWPHMTVFNNVAYPLRIRRRPAAEIEQKVTAALTLVEMAPYAQRPAPALSGGQQQRVAIARAVVFEPEVLLLDEPLSNLDAKLRTQMGDEFRALQKRLGITSLYVTHDQAEAMALSDRVVVMHAGKILQIGPPEEIYQRPANRTVAAFLGAPNLIEARVADCRSTGNGHYQLLLEGNGWRGTCPAGDKFAAGEAALMVLRPESVALAKSGAAPVDGQIAWQGKIANAIFRGARRSLMVETGSRQLTIEAPAEAQVGIGAPVTLLATPATAWAIRP